MLDGRVQIARGAYPAWKLNASEPSWSTVIIGATRRPVNAAIALLLDLEQARGDVLVDRRRELLGEPLLRRRLHQVDLCDQHLTRGDQFVRRPARSGTTCRTGGREHHDVLAVSHIGLEFLELLHPVGEGVVERQIAVAEWVRGVGSIGHGSIVAPLRKVA